jgi:hypothetical protein
MAVSVGKALPACANEDKELPFDDALITHLV